MTAIERHGSGAPYEPIVGYSRVVRAGQHVWVAGCAAIVDGDVVGETHGEQAKVCVDILLAALARVGASARDVVRTRLYVTDATKWEEVGRAHGEVFADIRPVTAMIEVKGFIDPRMLVEIEADAFVVGD